MRIKNIHKKRPFLVGNDVIYPNSIKDVSEKAIADFQNTDLGKRIFKDSFKIYDDKKTKTKTKNESTSNSKKLSSKDEF